MPTPVPPKRRVALVLSVEALEATLEAVNAQRAAIGKRLTEPRVEPHVARRLHGTLGDLSEAREELALVLEQTLEADVEAALARRRER